MDGEPGSQQYVFLEVLGRGTYGAVIKCAINDAHQQGQGPGHGGHGGGGGPSNNCQQPPPQQQQYVAVKRFHGALRDTHAWRLAAREARVLSAMRHPLVVALLDAFRSPSGRPYLVMEYVPRSVAAELSARPTGLPRRDVKLLTWQLTVALRHLHSNRVVHRDIKPSNLLLTRAGVLKLCDFGFARFTGCRDPRDSELLTTYVVTRWYRAPEVLLGLEYGAPADIWALGCTVAELATGAPLLPGTSTADQLSRIMHLFGPPGPTTTTAGVSPLRRQLPELGPCLLQLLEACFRTDPRDRPTAAQLLTMPYFFEVGNLVADTELAELYKQEMRRVAIEPLPSQDGATAAPPPSPSPLAPPEPLPTSAAAAAAATAAAKRPGASSKPLRSPSPDPLLSTDTAATAAAAAPVLPVSVRRHQRAAASVGGHLSPDDDGSSSAAAAAADAVAPAAGITRSITTDMFVPRATAGGGGGGGNRRLAERHQLRPAARSRATLSGYPEPEGSSNVLWVPWGSAWQAKLACVRQGATDGGAAASGGGGYMAPPTPAPVQPAPDDSMRSSDTTVRATRSLSHIRRSSAGGAVEAIWRRGLGRTDSSPPPLTAVSAAIAAAAMASTTVSLHSLRQVDAVASVRATRVTVATQINTGGSSDSNSRGQCGTAGGGKTGRPSTCTVTRSTGPLTESHFPLQYTRSQPQPETNCPSQPRKATAAAFGALKARCWFQTPRKPGTAVVDAAEAEEEEEMAAADGGGAGALPPRRARSVRDGGSMQRRRSTRSSGGGSVDDGGGGGGSNDWRRGALTADGGGVPAGGGRAERSWLWLWSGLTGRGSGGVGASKAGVRGPGEEQVRGVSMMPAPPSLPPMAAAAPPFLPYNNNSNAKAQLQQQQPTGSGWAAGGLLRSCFSRGWPPGGFAEENGEPAEAQAVTAGPATLMASGSAPV